MKYCANCGNPIENDSQTFCGKCGFAVKNNAAGGYNSPAASSYPMKWFKFLINFALFCGAVINFIGGITYITGSVYSIQTAGQANANLVYAVYGGALKGLDVLYGISMIGLAAFAVVTRFNLAKYKACGPQSLYILYIVSLAITIIYAALTGVITGVEVFSTIIATIIVQVVFLVLNYVYFSKRKELFCNR